jgi:hypothetical protein
MQEHSIKFSNVHKKQTYSPHHAQIFQKQSSLGPEETELHQSTRNTIAYSININPTYHPPSFNQPLSPPHTAPNIRSEQITD